MDTLASPGRYGVAVLTMGLLDGLWLGWLALDFYKREMGG